MRPELNLLSEQLVKKSFKDCNPEELRQLTADYPYFAPAHILLLKKLDPATEAYREQYQKAILYFSDPLSFEYFINREDFDSQFNPLDEEVKGEDIQKDKEIKTSMVEFVSTEDPADPEPPPLPDSLSPSLTTNESAEGLTFEPFHTVDYFASQGIKLSAEENSSDKFGKQLKSFTDWLKTMKRLPATQTAQPDTLSEQKVDHLADNSVQAAEVVTESMAEVWLKQGNREKAREVYRKLSLLDPSKNAYFAAKIESLKE